jgi:hypothetical protein
MTLKTRTPTGRAGWPKILVEGGDKAGKSWSLANLSASPKVGRTAVLVLGEDETRWDEYGKIPGARFEIIEHDGRWSSIISAVEDAKEEAARARDAGEPPFVLGIDTITAVWEGLKDWATLRARSSKKNKALLAADPDAEIDVTSNYWNDARGRNRALMRHLLTFPGIVVLIARGSEVTLFQNGQPVANRKTWSVDGEKNLPFDVSTHIRLSREDRPLLVSSSGLHCQIRPGIDPPKRLPDDWSLESVIFDMLKLDAATAEVREFTGFRQEMTPEEVRDEALDPKTGFERIRELYTYADRSFPAVELQNETGDEEPLLRMLKRVGDERRGAASPQPSVTPAETRAPEDDPQAAQPWLDAALDEAVAFTEKEAGQRLWREAAAKGRSGECTPEEVQQVHDRLTARFEDLKGEPSAEAFAAALARIGDGDWADKIGAIADEEEARRLIAEVDRSTVLTAARRHHIRDAVLIRWPGAAEELAAAS